MDIKSLIDDANTRSTKLYLQRQQLQGQLQQIQMAAQQVDMSLIKLDGEIEAYTKISELQKSENTAKVPFPKAIEIPKAIEK